METKTVLIAKQLWTVGRFQDGEVTVPAYLLESLLLECGAMRVEDAQYVELDATSLATSS